MARIIGIRHRVKKTAEGESRPTLVAIKTEGEMRTLELEDEQAELDFVFGKFPLAWRVAEPGEDLSVFPRHHVVERKKKSSDEKETRVPAEYDGFKTGDSTVMILGGSGDRLAYALSRQGEKIGAKVFCIPGFQLALRRNEVEKKEDHVTLTRVFETKPSLFYEFGPADRDNVMVSELHRSRRDAQVDRTACKQRLRQRLIGEVFLSEASGYPEGTIADEFDKAKANDVILSSLVKEEKRREAELKPAVHKLPIWQKFFADTEGAGEVLSAGIIAPIADIRIFQTEAKLKAFCGVHVLSDGRFARKRTGSTANWNPRARQALYLLGQQFVYRADSEWGVKLRQYKVGFRERHPVVECSTCGVPWEQCTKQTDAESEAVPGHKRHMRRYTNGHIHKMAIWRTLTRFVERLHREWTRIDADEKRKESAAA